MGLLEVELLEEQRYPLRTSDVAFGVELQVRDLLETTKGATK